MEVPGSSLLSVAIRAWAGKRPAVPRVAVETGLILQAGVSDEPRAPHRRNGEHDDRKRRTEFNRRRPPARHAQADALDRTPSERGLRTVHDARHLH